MHLARTHAYLEVQHGNLDMSAKEALTHYSVKIYADEIKQNREIR